MQAVQEILEHPEPGHRRRGQVFIEASEMCLRVIFELEEDDGIALRSSLTRRLGLSRPTVREHLRRLAEDELIDLERGEVFFTEGGRDRATAIVRKHRLAEVFLVQVVGLDWELAHAEASRWQHVLGTRAEAKLEVKLGGPSTSPFGCPIPPLGHDGPTVQRVGRAAGPSDSRLAVDAELIRMIDASDATSARVLVRRVPERLQTDRELLVSLRRAGIGPGVAAEVTLVGSDRDRVRVETRHGSLVLPSLASRSILVEGERRRPATPARPSWTFRGRSTAGRDDSRRT